jgi:hypothetical protein
LSVIMVSVVVPKISSAQHKNEKCGAKWWQKLVAGFLLV